MRRMIAAAVLGAGTLVLAPPAISVVPGLLGYEGHPGNQGGQPGGGGNDGGSKQCSPGQHGNPAPGFKPGSCDNN